MKRQTYKQKLAIDQKQYGEQVEVMYAEVMETQAELLERLAEYGSDLPLVEYRLEDFYPPKVFNSWQEALLDMAETAEVETLEKAAAAARRILKALPIKDGSLREKLLRDHLETLSEFSN
jgi:hypothetical protein